MNDDVISENVISKVALCKVRKKIKYDSFVERNDKAVEYFKQNFRPLTWNGHILKTIDAIT